MIEYLDSQLAPLGKSLSFDACLVSAGGNDFLPNIRQFVHRDADGSVAIDDDQLGRVFRDITANWGKLRTHLSRWNAPILTNGYGPIIPTLKPGTTWLPLLGIGPWVGPYLLHDLGQSQDDAQAIADDVMQRFNALAAGLPDVDYFSLVDTVRSMTPNMWHDEIHFVDEGWEKVAECWLGAINAAIGIGSAAAPVTKKATPLRGKPRSRKTRRK